MAQARPTGMDTVDTYTLLNSDKGPAAKADPRPQSTVFYCKAEQKAQRTKRELGGERRI